VGSLGFVFFPRTERHAELPLRNVPFPAKSVKLEGAALCPAPTRCLPGSDTLVSGDWEL